MNERTRQRRLLAINRARREAISQQRKRGLKFKQQNSKRRGQFAVAPDLSPDSSSIWRSPSLGFCAPQSSRSLSSGSRGSWERLGGCSSRPRRTCWGCPRRWTGCWRWTRCRWSSYRRRRACSSNMWNTRSPARQVIQEKKMTSSAARGARLWTRQQLLLLCAQIFHFWFEIAIDFIEVWMINERGALREEHLASVPLFFLVFGVFGYYENVPSQNKRITIFTFLIFQTPVEPHKISPQRACLSLCLQP